MPCLSPLRQRGRLPGPHDGLFTSACYQSRPGARATETLHGARGVMDSRWIMSSSDGKSFT